MVEITENIDLSKMGWLKFPKTFQCSKFSGWSCLKHSRAQNLMLKIIKMLKKAKSDGWNYEKHRTKQNGMVEVS